MTPKSAGSTTKVVFRRFPNGDIIALFPEERWNRLDYSVSSYMHVGQHGAADYDHVVAGSRPATESEYHNLLTELRAIGYNGLHIVRRARPKFN